MTTWYTHYGDDSKPPELADAQIIRVLTPDGRIHRHRADKFKWTLVRKYALDVDASGRAYCSALALAPETQYVAVEECAIGGHRVLQFKGEPQRGKPSLIAPERWCDGSSTGRVDAPETHRKPGDPAQSVMRVWSE